MKKADILAVSVFAAVFAAGAADLITAREATNIAESVVSRSVFGADGKVRAVTDYLYAVDFSDSFADDAAWYYGHLGASSEALGGCSARRIGMTVERNYDWFYDETAEFVVSVSKSANRFASLGVASVGTNLTDAIVRSGADSPFYRCLPGATLDGVNENGVAVEINVVITNGASWETRGGRDINAMGAVRWVLDHATSARSAAAELAGRVYIPDSMKRRGYSAHFAVCDRDESWIVEDGVAAIRERNVPAVVTNFRVLDPTEPYGTGYERYLMLTNAANPITAAWFREAYRRPFSRPTEFAAPGVGAWTDTAALLAWAEANIPQGAPETLERGGRSWQTLHTSVYDLEAKTLRIAVQERGEWFVFTLEGYGMPSAVTATPIPNDLKDRVSYVNWKTSGGETRPEDENGSVVIGKGAQGTIDPDYIASLSNATGNVTLRSEAVAIGHNATVSNTSTKATVQGISIGWNAKAVGSNPIAIGSGALHWYEDEEVGDRTYAKGSEAVAIGYCARALANQAVQIGNGVNDTPASLKFRNTFIVKDGKVQAGVETNEVEDISRRMLEPQVFVGLDEEITVRSHAITTYSPTGYVDEVAVTPTGSRNYELYFTNTAENRGRLPYLFQTEIDGDVTTFGTWWTNKVLRLPVKAAVKEPLPKTLILEVEEYADGWDWSPVVVRAFETNGAVRIDGTNLHFTAAASIGGVRHEVKNPLYGVVNVNTNGVTPMIGTLWGANGEELAGFVVE